MAAVGQGDGGAPAEAIHRGGERDAGPGLVPEEPPATVRDALDDRGARAAEKEAAGSGGGGLLGRSVAAEREGSEVAPRRRG